MKRILSLAIFCLALASPVFPVFAQNAAPDGTNEYVQTHIVPEFTTATPGNTLSLAIVQDIKPDWHTYWKNPGDSGEALSVTWKLPAGVTASEIAWPAPHRMPIGPLLNFGYEGRNVLLSDLSIPADYKAADLPVDVELSWLVCQEICIPETTTLHLSVPMTAPGAAAQESDPDLFKTARSRMPTPVEWPGRFEEQNGSLLLSLKPDSDQLALLKTARAIEFYPYEWGVIVNAATQATDIVDDELRLTLQRDTRALQGLGEVAGVLSYETAAGERRAVTVQVAVPALPEVVEKLAETSLQQNSAAASASLSLFQAIGLALIGGLILNLMPCVFPVLSMKALSLVKMSAREQAHAVTHGVAYTAGILVCFALIAGTLILLKQSGSVIGWGFQLQNPVVVLLLAYLLFLIGLNLSGAFEFGGTKLTNLGYKLTQKQGYAGSFFTGMLATIVATPCTAPLMGAAMGYALTQPPFAALSVFLALGFGLALPYLLLTVIPALRRALPKPGAWMETFRQFLAFPMFASTAWLVWVYGQQIDGAYGILLAGLGIVLIAMGVWIFKNAPSRQPMRGIVRSVAVLAFVVAVSIAAVSMVKLPRTINAGEQSEHGGNWTPFTKAALDQALASGRPVFVDMTAAWCITCKVNERVALDVDATIDLFKEKNITYLIGDWTNQNPEITEYLSTYGRSGVPLYVFYGAADQNGKRPDPVVLPQLLTPGLIDEIVTAE